MDARDERPSATIGGDTPAQEDGTTVKPVPRSLWVLCILTAHTHLLPVAHAQESYGPWEVRRGRTADWQDAGGFPTWTVTFRGPEETPDVRIDGDDDGKARGSIIIGRPVTLPQDELLSLDFAYATHCDLDTRSGSWDIAIIDAKAWDELADEPHTEVVFDANDRRVCLAAFRIKAHVGEDVDEPKRLDAMQALALAAQARRLAGREVVLAAAWTGYHGNAEWGALAGLQLKTFEPGDAMETLFGRLDLDRPELATVRTAAERDDYKAAAEALVRHFRARTEPVYPGDPRLRAEHTISAGRLEEADAALDNRFTGQPSYGLQPVPDDIDWSYNPGADPEWTWQFNRHSAWGALANAYLATGEEKYAEKWVALLRDWVLDNPPGTPWSWRTLEAGIRAQGWLPVYFSFINSLSFTPEDHVVFLSSLADHAEYLLPAGRFHSGSNWGQTESLGLLHIGSFFPAFRDATLWRDTAWQRLEAEMFAQVLDDGAQVELTTSYHQGCISGFIRAAEIAQLGGTEPSPEYWERLERMYEYTMFLQKPDGTQPMLGDSWPGNTSGIVTAGAERFDRPDMLYVGTRGERGREPEYLDTRLPAAGYYVMRTDWLDPQAIYCLVDVAHRWGGGHQQPDALQINLFACGKTLLPDSGSYLYYGPDRQRFALTSSHSTVTIDDANQNTSPATLHCFASTDALSFVDGSHGGYEGVTHRRQVLFARPVGEMPAYFLVIDRITGEGDHTVDQYFHFLPAPLELRAEAHEARTALSEGPNLLVRALRTDGLLTEEVESWVSFQYTRKELRPAVRYRRQGALPATFVTLLLPYPGAEPPSLTAEELPLPGAALAVRVEASGFTDVLFAAEQPVDIVLPGLSVRGRAGLRRTNQAGDPVELAVIEGTPD